MSENTCCFLGHRKIEVIDKLRKCLYNTIERLIEEERIETFLFGSRSQFDNLCHQIVTELKRYHPQIKRVYVRAEFPNITDDYKRYLLQNYEETYFPEYLIKAGKSAYVERNYEMIDKSKFCILYFDEDYMRTKSGTRIAYEYAKKKQKIIINIFQKENGY